MSKSVTVNLDEVAEKVGQTKGFTTPEDIAEHAIYAFQECIANGDPDDAIIERDWENGTITREEVVAVITRIIEDPQEVTFDSIGTHHRNGTPYFADKTKLNHDENSTTYEAVCVGCHGYGTVTVGHGWNVTYKCNNCGQENFIGG